MKPITWATLDYVAAGAFVWLGSRLNSPAEYGLAVAMFGFGIAWSIRAAIEDSKR